MNVAEKTIIEQAIKYPNDYKNIEALARLAEMAIIQRNELLIQGAKDRLELRKMGQAV